MQREADVMTKIVAAHKKLIGDKALDTIYVALLFTAPECQGKGYAGALLDAVCAKVSSSEKKSARY